MKYAKIVIIFLLLLILALGASLLLKKTKESDNIIKNEKISIPKIELPKKSIAFSITKKENNIIFEGDFAQKNTPISIAKLLNHLNLSHKININPALLQEEETIILLEKILKRFVENCTEGSILYSDKKLLITGKTTNKESKESIERLLKLSTIISFSNIKLIDKIKKTSSSDATTIISQLESVIKEEEQSEKENTLTQDEVQNILSNLAALAIATPTEKPKRKKEKSTIKEVVKKKIAKKKVIKKKRVVKIEPSPTPIIIYRDVYIEKPTTPTPTITPDITAEEYRRKLAQEGKPDEELISLPMVKKVDMYIEEKINRGEIRALTTQKPLVSQKTILIPSQEKKIDGAIPWADLHEVEEPTEGILLNESINYKRVNPNSLQLSTPPR
jgi:hypothetical protein